ncbi:MAG: hypothetical protein IKI29_00820 [Clostridia bacterium]|nr:hypothetical protein [Clostridia bacterium]
MEKKKALINISKKTFIQVTALLLGLLVVSIVLTYLIPAGSFGTYADGSTDYSVYRPLDAVKGVALWKGLLAPVLVFFSADGLTLIMLSLFLLVISASFQVMNDAGGIGAMVGAVSERFQNRKKLMIALISLLCMCFGAFLGLFEEMLTMLPILTMLCLAVGYDSFTGFLVCILSCGFGFASAVTNPFTVLLASEIIGTNPMENIWYRILIFAVMYLLLQTFIFLYLKKLEKNPKNSYTYEHDLRMKSSVNIYSNVPQKSPQQQKKIRTVYGLFLLCSLALIAVCSFVGALRDYTVVVLIAYFLLFGTLAGVWCTSSWKTVVQSFLKGLKGALPTIVFIALSASIKYVFDQGCVMPTITNQINLLAKGKNIFLIALIVYAVVLVLEFFISSSTAKAILVMGLLSTVSLGLSNQTLVLIYTFADGYTNVLFPTSPVLLISLSMIEMEYFKWVKKSVPLFAVNLLLVIAFILLGIVLGY